MLRWNLGRYGWLPILLLVLLFDVALARRWVEHRKDSSQNHHIRVAARQYGVHPALVKAVVWRESRFDASARGQAGELGLMQVGEAAALEWAWAEQRGDYQFEHLLDPGHNTRAGTWYLGKLLKRYTHTDNPLPYALADYNAGRRNALRWAHGPAATNSALFIDQIDFPTTQNYVRTVLDRYEFYRERF